MSHNVSEDPLRPSSPVKGLPRTPQRGTTVAVCFYMFHKFYISSLGSSQTREAQDRMNEMRQLIGKRFESDGAPRSRPGVFPSSPAPRQTENFQADGIAQSLQELVSEADKDLTRAVSNHDTLQDGLNLLVSDFKEVCF